MTYAELQTHLRNNHFYATVNSIIKKKDEVIESLEIPCPIFITKEKVNRIQEIVGDGFNAEYVSESEMVLITKK